MHRVHRDPDRSAGLDHLVSDGKRTLEGGQDLACRGNHVLRVPGVRGQHGKFVATQPRDRVGRAQDAAQARRHLLQETVAAVVAKGVVDVLEAIEVEQQDSEHLLIAPGRQQCLAQAVTEQASVGQAGECVVEGLVFERVGVRLALRDVAQRRDEHMT